MRTFLSFDFSPEIISIFDLFTFSSFERKVTSSLFARFSIGGEEIFILTNSSVKSAIFENDEFGTSFTLRMLPDLCSEINLYTSFMLKIIPHT